MPEWGARSTKLRQFSAKEFVARRSAGRYSRCVPVAIVDSGTVANHAASWCGGSNGEQPTAGTSKAKEGGSLTDTVSEAIGSAKLRFGLA